MKKNQKNIEKSDVKNIVRSCLYGDIDEIKFGNIPDEFNIKILLELYNNYLKFADITNETNRKDKLSKYENKIYFLKEGTLTEIEKIKLEMFKIDYTLYNKNKKEDFIQKFVFEEIMSINSILNKKKEAVNEVIYYLKERIVLLQILCDMDITFYNSAYNYFYSFVEKISKSKTLKKDG